MNKVSLNVIHLNSSMLNLVGPIRRGYRGGGGDVPVEPDVPIEPDVPEGYGVFYALDGAFSAADGDFYVKM